MKGLLVFKEWLRAFYGRYGLVVLLAARFLTAFLAVYVINRNAGFMPKLSGPLAPLAAGVVGACLPYGAIAMLAGGFLLAQLYAASLEVAVVTLVFLLLVVLLYYGFQPGDSVLLLVTPVLFYFHIPYVVPLLVGLAGGLVSVIPMSCGIFLYYVMLYVKQNSSFLAGSGQTEMTEIFAQVLKSLLTNQSMLLMIAACCLCVLAVHIVKNLSINYAWGLAIVTGVLMLLTIIFIGDFRFGVSVSVPELIAALAVSAAVAGIYHFFVFAVDYSRTEYVQFEDDEYYYYVKAVPKITVSRTDVKVQRINARKSPKSGSGQRS